MNYRISGLPLEVFKPYFELSDEDLAAQGMRRIAVDAKPGFPCRVSLQDAEVGETVLALNYAHQPATSPYKASGPIFVRERDMVPGEMADCIPAESRDRLLSVRAYDGEDLICNADVVEGDALDALIRQFFADEAVHYLHVHNARPGCFAFRVDRA